MSRTWVEARSSPVYSDRSDARITFERLKRIRTSSLSAATAPVDDETARIRSNGRTPRSVSHPNGQVRRAGLGWAQEGWASGGPCSLLGALHSSNAGTSEIRSGDAPAGRTYVVVGCWPRGIRAEKIDSVRMGTSLPPNSVMVRRLDVSAASSIRVKVILIPSGDQVRDRSRPRVACARRCVPPPDAAICSERELAPVGRPVRPYSAEPGVFVRFTSPVPSGSS